jgi:hypothetical protein
VGSCSQQRRHAMNQPPRRSTGGGRKGRRPRRRRRTRAAAVEIFYLTWTMGLGRKKESRARSLDYSIVSDLEPSRLVRVQEHTYTVSNR